MTDTIVLKRIKELENQNAKLKNLLDAALQLTTQPNDSNQLKQETEHLNQIIVELEEQKSQLQQTLKLTLDEQGISNVSDLNHINELEEENVELREKLKELIKNNEQEVDEIEALSSESQQLQTILNKLESEKESLVQEIKLIRETKSLNSHDQENPLLCPHNSTFSAKGEEILDKIENLEELKQKLQSKLEESKSSGLLNVPVENTVLELKISSLEREKCRLLQSLEDFVASTEESNNLTMCCEEFQVKRLINELEIQKVLLLINLKNLLEINKILEAKSSSSSASKEVPKTTSIQEELLTQMEANVDAFLTVTSPAEEVVPLSPIQEKLERSAKILLENVRRYDHAGEVITNYQKATRSLITPREIACVLKKDQENDAESSLEPEENLETPGNTKKVYFLESKVKENEEYQAIEQFSLDLPSVAEVDEMEDTASLEHSHLKSELTRLQQEKEDLLVKLKLVSPKASNDDNNNHNNVVVIGPLEEVIGEPMEQNRFMDDATNQMFADDEARLEQRIRELEIENERIRNELQMILNEIKRDRIDVDGVVE